MSPISVEDALRQSGKSIKQAVSALWDLDENRLTPEIDYSLDLQQPTDYAHAGIAASRPLFSQFSPEVWKRTTYGKFRNLLGRYDPRAFSIDTTDDEADFISTIIETPCLHFVRRWLISNGHLPPSTLKTFSSLLLKVWFSEHAGRNTQAQATGFQHVFCGEFRRSKGLSGLHNFISVFLAEQQGHLHYMGYDKSSLKVQSTELRKQHMLKIRFGLYGRQKQMSSMFFGVSPEFEVGLYSLMILAKKCEVATVLGTHHAVIKAVAKNRRVVTAFPLLLKATPARQKRLRPSRRQKNSVITLCEENNQTNKSSNITEVATDVCLGLQRLRIASKRTKRAQSSACAPLRVPCKKRRPRAKSTTMNLRSRKRQQMNTVQIGAVIDLDEIEPNPTKSVEEVIDLTPGDEASNLGHATMADSHLVCSARRSVIDLTLENS
ncbi:unnamed protein product [Chondrus crispus]|uniref:EndoU domain-containing protein n=1 Tax=Chondrus crispus TaxID=2769 RepID=R7QJJ6_CHOCR|nr:unnamed protein product [Chondrus crispus]CDF37575.1 unnamed protein product [Chondrus crispus]|eukprot:XP_005717446.1 unnamed protein product [Chondrus crispus]